MLGLHQNTCRDHVFQLAVGVMSCLATLHIRSQRVITHLRLILEASAPEQIAGIAHQGVLKNAQLRSPQTITPPVNIMLGSLFRFLFGLISDALCLLSSRNVLSGLIGRMEN